MKNPALYCVQGASASHKIITCSSKGSANEMGWRASWQQASPRPERRVRIQTQITVVVPSGKFDAIELGINDLGDGESFIYYVYLYIYITISISWIRADAEIRGTPNWFGGAMLMQLTVWYIYIYQRRVTFRKFVFWISHVVLWFQRKSRTTPARYEGIILNVEKSARRREFVRYLIFVQRWSVYSTRRI